MFSCLSESVEAWIEDVDRLPNDDQRLPLQTIALGDEELQNSDDNDIRQLFLPTFLSSSRT